MVNEARRGLIPKSQNTEALERKIIAIHRSTGTLMPWFNRWHNFLRLKLKWYYRWHMHPAAHAVHFTALALALALNLGSFSSILLYSPPQARASNLSIQMSGSVGSDTWLEYLSDNNHGTDSTIHVYTNSAGRYFGLFKFPLTSLPENAQISNANLTLYIESRTLGGLDTMEIRRVTSDWSEATATWNNAPSTDSSSTYRTDVLSSQTPGSVSYNVTALVNAWHEGSVSNYGFWFGFQGASSPDEYVFTSREGSGNRPILDITYSQPTSTPTPTPTPSPTPSSTATATPTPTPATTSTSTSTAISTATSTTAATPTPTAVPSTSTVNACNGITYDESISDTSAIIHFTTKTKNNTTLYWDTASHTSPSGAEKKKATLSAYPKDNVLKNTGTDHTFTISNLSPNTKYYYSVVNGTTQDCELSFATQSTPSPTPTLTPTEAALTTSPVPSLKPISTRDISADDAGSHRVSTNKVVAFFTGGAEVSTATTGAAVAGAATIATLGVPAFSAVSTLLQMLMNLPQAITTGWLNLLGILGLRKRKMPWGRVLDSVTNEPIVGALISIHNQDKYGQVAAREVSDKEGRYGFLVPPGHYSLWASKQGFTFPSQHLSASYHGTAFPIGGEGMIVIDLFCDPSEITLSWITRLKKIAVKVEILRIPLLALGSLMVLTSLVLNFMPLSALLAALYGVLWITEWKNRHTGRHTLSILDHTGQPLAFTVVRLINQNDNSVAFTKATDARGELFVLVQGGNYTLQVMRAGESAPFETTLALTKGIPLKHTEIHVSAPLYTPAVSSASQTVGTPPPALPTPGKP